MVSTIPEKLVGASYLFFLRGEVKADPLSVVREVISTSYTPQAPGSGPLTLGLDKAGAAVFASTNGSGVRLDLRYLSLANVLGVSLTRYIPDGNPPDWAEQIGFLNQCREALESRGANVLGSAVTAVGSADEDLDEFSKVIGERSKETASDLKGAVIHEFAAGPNLLAYYIDNRPGLDLSEFIAEKLPGAVWSIQRLTREMEFFKERLVTIVAEKDGIDRELSTIFHQKVAAERSDEDTAKILEDQITRLSKMYSIMATDLHLVSEAIDAFEKDLKVLEETVGDFAADDAGAFPHNHLTAFSKYLDDLQKRKADFRLSLDNTKAAIDIAQTQAEILRGSQGLTLAEQTRELLKQNVILQDERASLQAAASVVELVVIFYYTLVSWQYVAPHGLVEELSSGVKFGVVGMFSLSTVVLTHYVGVSLHKKKIKWIPILLSSALALASLAAMAVLPGTVAEAGN